MNEDNQNVITPIDLAKKILEFSSSSWVEKAQFDDFIEFVGIESLAQKVDFIQRLLALIKRLPPKIVEKEVQEKIADAGKDYLDILIGEEEETEEEEEEG